MFTPFFRGGAERKRYGGTGLGLSISRRLADAMGGRIDVESTENVGSLFTLSLPVTSSEAGETVTPATAEQSVRSPEVTSGGRYPRIDASVLLADDRRDIWRVVRYFLEKCHMRVTIAEDGRQAVDAAVRRRNDGHPFDLILMDMQMPVMDGRDATARLRSLGFGIPIIALTADAMEGEREECISIGCTDYVPKPVDGKRLIDSIVRALPHRVRPFGSADEPAPTDIPSGEPTFSDADNGNDRGE